MTLHLAPTAYPSYTHHTPCTPHPHPPTHTQIHSLSQPTPGQLEGETFLPSFQVTQDPNDSNNNLATFSFGERDDQAQLEAGAYIIQMIVYNTKCPSRSSSNMSDPGTVCECVVVVGGGVLWVWMWVLDVCVCVSHVSLCACFCLKCTVHTTHTHCEHHTSGGGGRSSAKCCIQHCPIKQQPARAVQHLLCSVCVLVCLCLCTCIVCSVCDACVRALFLFLACCVVCVVCFMYITTIIMPYHLAQLRSCTHPPSSPSSSSPPTPVTTLTTHAHHHHHYHHHHLYHRPHPHSVSFVPWNEVDGVPCCSYTAQVYMGTGASNSDPSTW